MPTISLRRAEMLSYLQGCGPVGEWVAPLTKHISADLGFSNPHVCKLVANLVRNGFVEVRRIGLKRKEYRVLVRLETPGVEIIDHGERSELAKERMRMKALAREARRRAKRPKIRWAGYAARSAAQW